MSQATTWATFNSATTGSSSATADAVAALLLVIGVSCLVEEGGWLPRDCLDSLCHLGFIASDALSLPLDDVRELLSDAVFPKIVAMRFLQLLRDVRARAPGGGGSGGGGGDPTLASPVNPFLEGTSSAGPVPAESTAEASLLMQFAGMAVGGNAPAAAPLQPPATPVTPMPNSGAASASYDQANKEAVAHVLGRGPDAVRESGAGSGDAAGDFWKMMAKSMDPKERHLLVGNYYKGMAGTYDGFNAFLTECVDALIMLGDAYGAASYRVMTFQRRLAIWQHCWSEGKLYALKVIARSSCTLEPLTLPPQMEEGFRARRDKYFGELLGRVSAAAVDRRLTALETAASTSTKEETKTKSNPSTRTCFECGAKGHMCFDKDESGAFVCPVMRANGGKRLYAHCPPHLIPTEATQHQGNEDGEEEQ